MTDAIDDIRRLEALRAQGLLSEEEFARAKAQLLNQVGQMGNPPGSPQFAPAATRSVRDVAVWMHVSAIALWVIPLIGIVAPIVLWQTNRDDPLLDAHGKIVMNWVLSSLIYALGSLLLLIVLIGGLTLFATMVLGFVFPIMGAVRASRGEVWPYPISIPFFK